jgi:hypothetical protein
MIYIKFYILVILTFLIAGFCFELGTTLFWNIPHGLGVG